MNFSKLRKGFQSILTQIIAQFLFSDTKTDVCIIFFARRAVKRSKTTYPHMNSVD